MRWLPLLGLLCTVSANTAAASVQLRQRDVALDSSQEIHPVTITGAHGVGTNIRLPDDFDPKNVLCGGQCVTPTAGQSAADVAEQVEKDDPRNWVMEINQEARVISVRPRNLPTKADNPATAFTTNIFVKLDGGHVVNVTLRLISLRDGESAADGLVNLLLPSSSTLAGKLKLKSKELEDEYEKRVAQGVSRRFAKDLGEGFDCRSINLFAKAHRNEGIVVYLRQICSTKGDARLFWVVFDVANRSDRGVRLARATLDAVSATEKERIVTQSHLFRQDAMFFGEEGRGVATASVLPRPPSQGASAAMLLNKWSLTVETTSGDVVVADDVRF